VLFRSNGNGSIEPGESIALTVLAKNFWQEAPDVQALLTSSSPNVEVTSGFFDCGAIAGGAIVSATFELQVAPLAKEPGTLSFSCQFENADYEAAMPFDLPIPVPVKEGWPQTIRPISVTAVDLDGAGGEEVAALSLADADLARIDLFNLDGTAFSAAWPMQIHGAGDVSHELTFGDLEGDGLQEIVWVQDYLLHAFRLDGTELAGWPVALAAGNRYCSQAACADLLPDLAGLETAILSLSQDKTARLQAFGADGQPLPGFPVDLAEGAAFFENRAPTPALGDLDGDGALELVAGMYISDFPERGFIKAYSRDGSPKWSFPVPKLGEYYGPPVSIVLGDIDHKPGRETVFSIVETVVEANTRKNYYVVFVVNQFGTYFNPQWSQGITSPAHDIALADLDGDLELEIVTAGTDQPRITVFRPDGSFAAGWPVLIHDKKNYQTHKVRIGGIGDVDGDGWQEVLVSNLDHVYIFNHDGTVAEGADPLVCTEAPEAEIDDFRCAPSFSDLDSDGVLDILGAVPTGAQYSDGLIYLWTYPAGGVSPKAVPWPMARFDPGRTGCK